MYFPIVVPVYLYIPPFLVMRIVIYATFKGINANSLHDAVSTLIICAFVFYIDIICMQYLLNDIISFHYYLLPLSSEG